MIRTSATILGLICAGMGLFALTGEAAGQTGRKIMMGDTRKYDCR